ncbi:MAG: aminotransferase class III-fold pyridoxal phosphate-dependent enzyme [Patescibacteria group bacterium]
MNTVEKDNEHSLNVYKRYPVTLVKGKGARLWDDAGKEYVDFYAGHAVCSMGQCHPAVTEAIKKQADEMTFYSNIFYTAPAALLAEKIAGTLLPDSYKIYLTNSGSEANEAALKISRKSSGKKKIISFQNAFHGRSISNIGITGVMSYHKFEPNITTYTSFATLGDMESVKNLYDDDTAAVICEPIQSIGGMFMADLSFYHELEAFCREKGILLIVDEVQTGCGRNGADIWFSRAIGIHPDIITTAKGIAAGLPLAAVMIRDNVAKKVELYDHATTFGGGPIPCVASLAVFDTLTSDGFMQEVNRKSKLIIDGVSKIPGVKSVLGMGLLLGVEFDSDVTWLVKACLDRGLIIGSSSRKSVVRITPPLVITDEDINIFLEIFNKSI